MTIKNKIHFINKKPADNKDKPFDSRNDLKKLSLYVVIVNFGQSNAVISLLNSIGCSASFVQVGRGTASKSVLDVLGIEENKKEVVLSLIPKDNVSQVKNELEAFFASNKRNKGIGFSVCMNSLAGVKLYRFLADMI